MLAETKSTGEIEDNRDVGARICHRWHYRLAHLRPARQLQALTPFAPAPENPIRSDLTSQPVEAGRSRSAKAALGLAKKLHVYVELKSRQCFHTALNVGLMYQWIAAEADHGSNLVGPCGQNGLVDVPRPKRVPDRLVARVGGPSKPRRIAAFSLGEKLKPFHRPGWAASRSAHCCRAHRIGRSGHRGSTPRGWSAWRCCAFRAQSRRSSGTAVRWRTVSLPAEHLRLSIQVIRLRAFGRVLRGSPGKQRKGRSHMSPKRPRPVDRRNCRRARAACRCSA